MKHPKHIAICGNIGSGKTTLTEKLAKHYGWRPLFESVEDNPYLRDFYQDMSRWAFHVQVYFLNSRFSQHNQIRESKQTTIQDRTIYEDAHIFATNLHSSGHMTSRDYQTYLDVFNAMIKFVDPPDLLIYLKADIDKLVKQIQLRDHDYEYAIRLDYLKTLNQHYEKWVGQYKQSKLLIIDVNPLDFVQRPEDFSYIVNRIDFELHNLFDM